MGAYILKLAAAAWEFEAIHRLNHRAFAEEIPQHALRADGRLVDPFHDENHYLIALAGRTLCAMLAFRDRRPFSLDRKLPNLDVYLPSGRRLVELRLLTIHPDHRGGLLLGRLLIEATRTCLERGYTLALASGTTRQLPMYARLGFVSFGPLLGTPDAQFQPMYLTPEAVLARLPWLSRTLTPLTLEGVGDGPPISE